MRHMTIVAINIILGSIILISGVNTLSASLEKMGKSGILKAYQKKNLSLLKAFFLSIIITAILQSSSAITVITVSLVNSGVIDLNAAMGIIYGTNIGTTVTAQLMSIDIKGIEFVLLCFTGISALFSHNNRKVMQLTKALFGLSLLFLGLRILHSSVPFIRDSQSIMAFIKRYGGSVFNCFLFGAIVTMLVHSSAATTGFAIVLFNNGFIPFSCAVALVLGDNIGTCITAQVASIGTSVNARRVALAHTLYNIIGSLLALLALPAFISIVMAATSIAGQGENSLVANAHTIFNILSALLFMPFNKYYIRLLNRLIK